MKKLPAVKPRRPFMNGGVYEESDQDYVLNNLELCVVLLDQLASKIKEKTSWAPALYKGVPKRAKKK
jgi:hypothetical protein